MALLTPLLLQPCIMHAAQRLQVIAQKKCARVTCKHVCIAGPRAGPDQQEPAVYMAVSAGVKPHTTNAHSSMRNN